MGRYPRSLFPPRCMYSSTKGRARPSPLRLSTKQTNQHYCTTCPPSPTRKKKTQKKSTPQATAERLKKARAEAAVRLQAFARNRARRHKLNKRFAARKAKLRFERRNRAELASACLVMFKPRQAIRDATGQEDFKAMGDAVRPAVAVARLRASAAARGVSLSEMSERSTGGVGSDAAEGSDDGACASRSESSRVGRSWVGWGFEI